MRFIRNRLAGGIVLGRWCFCWVGRPVRPAWFIAKRGAYWIVRLYRLQVRRDDAVLACRCGRVATHIHIDGADSALVCPDYPWCEAFYEHAKVRSL